MERSRNTDVEGNPFSETTKDEVWNKCSTITGRDGKEYRNDACGKEIWYSRYGNTASSFGWEIDHIKPVAEGGTDEPSNLQALFWETNRDKGDTYPWECP